MNDRFREGAGPGPRIHVRLDPTTEFDFLGGTLRPAPRIPGRNVTLALGEVERGRLEYVIPVDVHTDRAVLQIVDPPGRSIAASSSPTPRPPPTGTTTTYG